MQAYHCPDCGRFLFASDAPPGYRVRVPRCAKCREGKLLTTNGTAPQSPTPAR